MPTHETGSIEVTRADANTVQIDFCGDAVVTLPDATAHDLGKILVQIAGLEVDGA